MTGLALDILWFALGLILVLGALAILMWAIKQWIPLDRRIEMTVYAVALILILIYAITTFAGGGGGRHGFSSLGIPGPALAAYTAAPARYLQSL